MELLSLKCRASCGNCRQTNETSRLHVTPLHFTSLPITSLPFPSLPFPPSLHSTSTQLSQLISYYMVSTSPVDA